LRIAFFVERPTQFEVPFYRFAARDPEHRLRVVYTGADPGAPVYDPELSRKISWGFDLLEGYDWGAVPAQGAGRWLARELAPGSYDLVIVNGYTQRTYLRTVLRARRSGLATGLRLDSVAFSGATARGRETAKRLLFRTAISRLYDLFFGVGSLSLDHLRSLGIAEERLALFPYAIDVESFRARSRLSPGERSAVRARLGIPEGARAVLSLAKFGPREAPWDLLRAFPQLAAADPGAVLVLAGDGPERGALEAEALRLGVSEKVAFPGYVPYPELPALYAAADLFVHPAAEERWGVSVQEALACGLPVIASERVGAGYDLIAPGRNGFRYAAGNVEDLGRRLAEALARPQAEIDAASAEILARWDYAATWRHLLAAVDRLGSEDS